ncbi:hypothetical protein FOCC_FOCC006238 [Frankliniella occidentalis]|nr:hypothetical protein FOCC_FOCC006238 [Frankliniella occidentalis]
MTSNRFCTYKTIVYIKNYIKYNNTEPNTCYVNYHRRLRASLTTRRVLDDDPAPTLNKPEITQRIPLKFPNNFNPDYCLQHVNQKIYNYQEFEQLEQKD